MKNNRNVPNSLFDSKTIITHPSCKHMYTLHNITQYKKKIIHTHRHHLHTLLFLILTEIRKIKKKRDIECKREHYNSTN